ncbi:hypothetical protein R3I94_002732 [Phoxinus phoxinus]
MCISDEKCVCVEVRRKPSPSHHQLVTKNLQTGGIVNVYDILYETRKCMAFCFELGDKAILPFTDGKDVKFEELSSRQKVTEETFNDTFLFQWGEAGSTDWRSLNLDSNHGPSFCEATVLSTKSACRHKRKTMKIKAFKCSRTKGP